MKEATGELNMTVITIIAIGAIIGFFWLMWPAIQGAIEDNWNSATDPANNTTNSSFGNQSQGD